MKTACKVIRTLRQHGFIALLAGGCVRDRLLKRQPKDFDVATSATPTQVEKIFPKTVAVGKSFGVIRVLFDNETIEVATFRSDGSYVDGRHPTTVQFSSPEKDALRRDFTINGLFEDPLTPHRKKTFSPIIDYVQGQCDLRRKQIRAIGKPTQRFQEDHLRLLRAIRFAAQLGFKIESNTWRAIVKMAPKIKTVSAERIRDELSKLLTARHRVQGIKLLHRSGLLHWILPEMERLRGVAQPRAYHPEGDVWRHTLKVLEFLRKPSPNLAWSALLHDIGKPPTAEKSLARHRIRLRFPNHAQVGADMADQITRRLRFSNSDREAIRTMVANHMTFMNVPEMRTSTIKRLLARTTIAEELELHRADCLSSHRRLKNLTLLRRWQKKLSNEQIRPPRLLTGLDLMKLGLQPGPIFSQILQQIEEEQLEGRIIDKESALDFVRKTTGIPDGQGSSHRDD